jgi:hypothetical protein
MSVPAASKKMVLSGADLRMVLFTESRFRYEKAMFRDWQALS